MDTKKLFCFRLSETDYVNFAKRAIRRSLNSSIICIPNFWCKRKPILDMYTIDMYTIHVQQSEIYPSWKQCSIILTMRTKTILKAWSLLANQYTWWAIKMKKLKETETCDSRPVTKVVLDLTKRWKWICQLKQNVLYTMYIYINPNHIYWWSSSLGKHLKKSTSPIF